MSSDAFPGSKLRERREALGLSLMDVHDKIHVPIVHLRAIESNRFDVLPEPAYVRGFVQSYCAALEIDAEPFLLHCPTVGAKRTQSLALRAFSGFGQPGWVTEGAAWASICLLLLFGWFTYTVVIRPLAENARPPVEAGELDIAPPRHFEDDF